MILNRPKIYKLPSYLSPSSLRKILKEPCSFYLERLMKDPEWKDEQSVPAAVGSAFDYFCKVSIAKHLGHMEKLRVTLLNSLRPDDKAKYAGKSVNDILWQLAVKPEHKTIAAGAGKMAFDAYQPALSLDEYVEIEVHGKITLDFNGVLIPVMGKSDATISLGNGAYYPKDWKVTGYGSSIQCNPYYFKLWEGPIDYGAHKEYKAGIPMSRINQEWNDQLAVYGWLLGHPVGEPFFGFIDQLTFKSNPLRVIVTQYKGLITKESQMPLLEKYAKAWQSLKSGSFLDRIPKDEDLVRYAAMEETFF
jgi:hypothetical protein